MNTLTWCIKSEHVANVDSNDLAPRREAVWPELWGTTAMSNQERNVTVLRGRLACSFKFRFPAVTPDFVLEVRFL